MIDSIQVVESATENWVGTAIVLIIPASTSRDSCIHYCNSLHMQLCAVTRRLNSKHVRELLSANSSVVSQGSM